MFEAFILIASCIASIICAIYAILSYHKKDKK